MKNRVLFALMFLCSTVYAQPVVASFEQAKDDGIRIEHLDSTYKSAVHFDTTKAVFKSAKQQKKVMREYSKLFEDLGKYLSEHDFYWDKQTRCFNRLYFNADGTVDYFLYNFLGSGEQLPSPEKQKQFETLVSAFIREHKVDLKANEKYAQCSPITYQPKPVTK
jgi:hypothetical protein